MARPRKSDADYFSHDKDMRNNDRIRAVRRRFGIAGYAVWCMVLEKLTDEEGWKAVYNEFTIESWADDFIIDIETLQRIIEYMVSINLLSIEDSMIFSKKLIERFSLLVEKRVREKEKVQKMVRGEDGKFTKPP